MSSDSDLHTGITQQIALQKTKPTKKTKKTNTRTKTKPTPTDHGKNEGDNPHWAYTPPEGARLLDHTVDAGPFDWDALKDDPDTELWLIRVPDAIKPKHLDGLEIYPPSSSRTARVGGLARKHASYDVWSVGDDDAEFAGGEELRGLSCLVPRKKKHGKLYVAPKRISHCIVISTQPSIATPPEHQIICQNPPRPSYPKDVLKHSFVPYGARSLQTQSEDVSMDTDDIEVIVVDKPVVTVEKPEKTKGSDSKGKKRSKVDDAPKKSKKHKANA